MPNIIEQQDLLKGLPDNRLALLMQQPTGDIPPFLVAAEAQRRQAIRQQFAGSGTEESVVDSLTKQLANVPQNIQGSTQAPPVPQAGIAALQQAPQQGAPQAPQQEAQQMAYGGMVQRYQTGSLVTPTFRGRYGAGGYEEPSSSWGVLGDLYDSASASVGSFTENLRKFGVNPTAEQREQLLAENEAAAPPAKPEYIDPFVAARRPAPYGRPPVPPPAPRDPSTGTGETSYENQDKAESAKYREQLAELFAAEEPSNWEEAQKWFAMSAQIMNPDANLLQGLVNAGAVYSQAEAEQAAAQREADRELKKALLQYDIGERDYARQVAEDERASIAAGIKAKTDIATGSISDIQRERSDIARDMQALEREIAKGTITDEEYIKAERKTLKAAYDDAGKRLAAYNTYLQDQYGFPIIEVVR